MQTISLGESLRKMSVPISGKNKNSSSAETFFKYCIVLDKVILEMINRTSFVILQQNIPYGHSSS